MGFPSRPVLVSLTTLTIVILKEVRAIMLSQILTIEWEIKQDSFTLVRVELQIKVDMEVIME